MILTFEKNKVLKNGCTATVRNYTKRSIDVFFFSKVLGNKSLFYSLLILSRFDINWLKPQYRDLDKVKKLPDDVLPQISKRVIEGVHRRDYRKGLMAESPSKPGRFRISRPSLWPLDFFSTT